MSKQQDRDVLLSEFTVVPATYAQIVQHARVAHSHWSHGHSFEDFLEGTMREHDHEPWGREGLHRVWLQCANIRVLVRRDDLEGKIYSGCEVYRRTILVKRPDSNDVEKGVMYGIASVITPTQQLKRGYATHLLRLLHYQMADKTHMPLFPSAWGAPPPTTLIEAEGTPGALASLLWSDVGYKFYEKCTVGEDRPGWVVKPEQNIELVWQCLPSKEADVDGDSTQGPKELDWEWIQKSDIPDVASYLSQKVVERLKGTQSKHTIYMPDPESPGLLTWLSVRGPWLGKKKPPADEPSGIRLKNADGDDTIVLFTAYNEHVGPRLLITYSLNLRPEHLPSLLEQLDTVASRAGRGEGWIWGLEFEDELVKAWEGLPQRQVRKGYRDEIKGHLLGVAWYGEEKDKGEFADWQIWDWC